ncbi:hypothetical protein [Haloarchaeobius baliensis]|uniref:hypothetical protein n=1 Tax=Haloarchaeobius baliensis TaxID=1670458 RepID=UPI003F881209
MTGQNRREFLQHSASAAGLTSLMSVHSLLGMTPYVDERWHRVFEETPDQHAKELVRTRDGRLVVATFTRAAGTVWLLKLRRDGTVEWEQEFGAVDGVTTDIPIDLAESGDGSLFLAVAGDGWNVVKTSPAGEPEWIRPWLPETGNLRDVDGPLKLAADSAGGCAVSAVVGRGESAREYETMIEAVRFSSEGEPRWQRRTAPEYPDAQVVALSIESDGVYVASNPRSNFRVDRFTDSSVEMQQSVNLIENPQGYGNVSGIYSNAVRLPDGGYVVSHATTGAIRLDESGTVIWNAHHDFRDMVEETVAPGLSTTDSGRVVTVGTSTYEDELWGWIVVMDIEDGSIEVAHEFRDAEGGAAYREPQAVVSSDDGFVVSGFQSPDDSTETDLWLSGVSVEQDNTPDLVPTLAGIGAVGAGGWAVRRWQSDEDTNEDDESSSGWHDRIS